MTDKKTIGVTSLITAGVVFLATLVPGLFDSPQYFCAERPELGLIQCDSFSKYVAENGKCIRDNEPNLICRAGWIEVVDDRVTEKEENVTELGKAYVIGNRVYEKKDGLYCKYTVINESFGKLVDCRDEISWTDQNTIDNFAEIERSLQ